VTVALSRAGSELLDTFFLLVAVIGSGIMAERLTDDIALALLANTIATSATLFVLITAFGPVSGAHFNPAVTLAMALRSRIGWLEGGGGR
jgi:glycerol uptake facilitator-like aquaporin